MRRLTTMTAVVLIALGACGSSKDDKKATSSTTRATLTTATVKSGTTTTLSPVDSPTSYKDSGDYVNGRHAAYITSVDGAARTVTIDVIQFLTGDAAVKAYKEDTGSTEPPDNDYYIRNQSKQLRTFPVADSADIRVNIVGGYDPSDPENGHKVDWETFTSYFSGDREGTAKGAPFWITLSAASATAIQEQYVP